MASFVAHLRSQLAAPSAVLLPDEPAFKEALKRWSDLDIRVPQAIVQPADEAAVITTVRGAIEAGVAFVIASGGHSSWSTIKDGIVVDLSQYKKIALDKARETVTVSGGVLMKELQTDLSAAGRFTTVGNGNTVGVIPYFINGGISIYTPLLGYGCENIVSARLLTAKGEVVTASASENADLFWGVRGAGQFLGLVLDLTIRTFPLTKISAEGTRQLGMYFFTPDKAEAVCKAMTAIVNDTKYTHAGHFMAVNAPPDFKHQALLVAPQMFGTTEELAELFQPLVDIGPMQQMQMPSDFEHHSDHLDYLCGKGDLKRFSQIGLQSWDPKAFEEIIKLQAQLCKECPGAEKSGYTFEWHTPTKGHDAPDVDTAFGMKDIQHWVNVLSWYHDPSQNQKIAEFDHAVQKAARSAATEDNFIAYTNSHREVPLEYRYKGQDRIARLKALKQEWDPKGVFTRELL